MTAVSAIVSGIVSGPLGLGPPALARRLLVGASVLLLGVAACGRDGRGSRTPDGPTSEIEANRFIRRAIRQSSDGFILIPSQRAERVFELPRLNEIAQGLRGPAARCFLARAIETMEPRTDGESGYTHVPEGQAKVRVRINPAGEVVRTEVLESGFADEQMEPCLREVLESQRWPPNKSGNTHYIDVVYWVSLGMQRGLGTEEMNTWIRREQIGAGRRAKACVQGRVDAGRYEIEGLNLVDREGGTMVNRIDTGDLPEPIRACIATALRELRLPRDPDAFVRPVSPRVVFEIDRDGTVRVEGERWLELVELEERAKLAAERARLAEEGVLGDEAVDEAMVDELPPRRPEDEGPTAGVVGDRVGEGPAGPGTDARDRDRVGDADRGPVVLAPGGDGSSDPPPRDTSPPPTRPTQDPGQPGLRLELGGRGGDD